jgi:hypothetical protein
MTPRTMLDLLSALQLLQTGRTNEAREVIETVVRENGGCLPTAPVIAFARPETPRPLWMRSGR